MLNKNKKNESESFGVIGLGRFGTALAITIAKAGKDVIVIDRCEAKVKELRQYTDYAFVIDELNTDTLKEVGIQNCDTVIVCIGEKMDTSILTTMCVVEMGIPHVIAKALTAEQGAVLEKLGAQVVYPERDMAIRLGKRLISRNFLDYVSLDNSVEIRQIIVSGKLVGKTIEEYGICKKYKLNVIAIESGRTTNIEVQPDYRLNEGDVIVVIGKIDKMDRFEADM